MTISDLTMMEIQIDTLFVSDDCRRLCLINEPCGSGDDPAPTLFVGTTGFGSIVRFGCDLPDDVCERIDVLMRDRTHDGDFNRDSPNFDALMDVISPYLRTGRLWTGPAYRFPEVDRRTRYRGEDRQQ